MWTIDLYSLEDVDDVSLYLIIHWLVLLFIPLRIPY